MMMANNALFTGIIRHDGGEGKTQKNLSAADSLSASPQDGISLNRCKPVKEATNWRQVAPWAVDLAGAFARA